jgi:two-component system sensor histidine kinase RpfC
MSAPATSGRARRPLPRPLAWIRRRLSNRPDGEHEIVINRLVIGILVLGYVMFAEPFTPVFYFATLFATAATAFFVHMLWRPGASEARCAIGRFVDLGALSYGIHLGDATTAILYPLYLWVIFGNGFRFGLPALRSAALIGVTGFGLAIATTPFWHDNVQLSIGLLVGLIVLPAYAGTLIKKLSRAKLAAEEASRAKSLFLASVSHELRTPLNAVIGMTDLLEGTELDAEQRDMARTAGDAGRTLLGLIDELLNFSRLEAGRMPRQAVDFDLHQVLAEARGMLIAQAREKNLRLGLHVTPRTPYRLHGEARHVRDVLINLIGNAVKFTENGGVVAAVDMVGGTPERPRLRFEVTDTGIGIAPEARSRIFESFTQADETIINSHGGTGLGLAICRQLVELQGGVIEVESELGAGSTFSFELDFDLASATADLPEVRPAAQVVAVGANEERAARLVAALAAGGYSAVPAASPREAIRILGAGPAHIRRIVVIDAEGAASDGEAIAGAINAADEETLFEIALLDPRLAPGLPELELRLLCASAAPSAPDAATLAAMVRIASVGAMVARGAPRSAAAASEAAQSGRRLSILVAEDNRTNQKVITKVLERAGHDVRIAENGELALDALTERAFDLVLMDVNMPVLDGIECTKLYRFASIGKKRVPIVALTADATPDARARCLDAGMDGCLTKPIEPERLLAMIGEIGGEEPERAVEAAERSEPVDDEIVANIARHPNFRPAKRVVVDRRTLAELEELGGPGFVHDLVGEFIGDAAAVLRSLDAAVRAGEPGVFREQAHALRSGAANIGARGIYELCLSYRNIGPLDLALHGAEHVRSLEAEFERVRKTLRRQFPEADASREA